MKRFVSLLLTLAMVLSLMAGITVGVSAETTEITQLYLIGQIPPEPVAGETVPDVSVSVPNDANYHLVWGDTWSYMDADNSKDLVAGEVFPVYSDFWTSVALAPNEGYTFGNDVKVYIGDTLATDLGFLIQVYSDTLYLDRFSEYQSVMLDEAVVTGPAFPELQVGDTLPELIYTAPEDANYVVDTAWRENSMIVAAGTEVVEGNTYTLNIFVHGKDGYAMANDGQLLINGVSEEFESWADGGMNYRYWIFSKPYMEEEKELITEVRLNGEIPPEPALDETVPDITLSAAEDAPYSVGWDGEVRYFKVDEETANSKEVAAGTVFEPDTIYHYQVSITANEGYVFSEDVQVYIGGILAENADIYPDISEEEVWLWQERRTEPYYLNEAVVNGTAFPDLKIGDTLPELSYSVPQDAHYSLDVSWTKNNEQVAAGTVVEDGNLYEIFIRVDADDGYAFRRGDYTLLINGEDCDYNTTDSRGENGFVGCLFYKEYVFLKPVEKVEVSYAEPVAGEPLSGVSVPDGACYKASALWYDYMTDAWVEPGTIAIKGHRYDVTLDVRPAEGYGFTEDTQFWANGALYTEHSPGSINIQTTYIWYCSTTFMLADPINKVEISYAEPVIGEPLSEVTTPKGALYTVETCWYDYTLEQDVDVGTVAQKGHIYDASVYVTPQMGYMVDDDTQFWVNGILQTEETPGYWEIYPDYIYYCIPEYALGDPISKVEISYAEPVAGEPLPDVVIPAGANYTVYAEWYDYNGDEGDEHREPGFIAERGHRYDLEIDISPAEGYKFTEDTQVWLNGEKLDPDVEYAEDSVAISAGGIYIDTREYSLMDKIAEVRLTYAEPVLGQPLPTPVVDNANCTVDTYWYDNTIDDKAPVGAVAEKGHIYELGCTVVAELGYGFNEDTKFYVNGQKIELGDDVGYDETAIYYYGVTYSFCEKIKTVSLTIADLKVGKSFPEAIAPQSAPYEVSSIWYNAIIGGGVEDTVQADGSYDINVFVEPAAGYEFAEDVELIVNGKKVDIGDYYLEAFWLEYYKHVTFLTSVKTVALPAIPELKVGDTLPEVVGSGKGYEYAIIAEGRDEEGNELTGNKVVQGGFYNVAVVAVPTEGYEFGEDTTFTVGGKEPSAFANAIYGYFADYKIFAFDGTQMISQIEIDAEIPVIGQSRGGEVSAAEDAGYMLEYATWGVASDGTLKDATDLTKPLKAGQHVLMALDVYAMEGYLFNADQKVIINGKEYTPVSISGSPSWMYIIIDLGEAQEQEVPDYNGLVVVDGVWGYYEGGILQEDYTGLVPYGDLIFYVENGILDFTYTGLAWYNDAWTYVANSQLTQGYTGLVWFNDNWFYVVDSVIDWTFTGLVPYEGNYFYVQNNLLDWSYTGLGYHDGGWYFIQNGLLQKEYSGLVYFNDNWFYVEEGVLTYQFFGMVEYQGNMFYVQASHLDWNYTGLGYHEGVWYYFLNALYMPEYDGLAELEGNVFYVEDGTVNWGFTGEVVIDGVTYTVKDGLVINS